MSATRDHVSVAGSKIAVSLIPIRPVLSPPHPPITSTRPSGSSAIPEQKMLSGAVWVVNVLLFGSQTWVGSGCCQPSNCSSLPLDSRIEWIAVIGQFSTGPHDPPLAAAGVTAADGLDSGPVPTALVALTVNV